MLGRTARTFAFGAVLIALYAAFVTPDRNITQREVWVLKAYWKRCADVVLAGDSTVLWSLDPAVIESYVPALRVVNLAYNDTAFVGSYLDAIDRVIDPASPAGVIVIGLSPMTTTPRQDMNQTFVRAEKVQAARGRAKPRLERTWTEELKNRLQTRSLCEFLLGACEGRFESRVGAHGFTPTVRRPFDLTIHEPWVTLGPGFKFTMRFVTQFLERVRAWRSRGIKVLGLVMPKSALMYQQMKRSGYDEKALLDAFVDAGGVLLEGPAEADTFDGVHLSPAAAAALTRTVSEQLARIVGPLPPRLQPERCPWPEPRP
jgi:hypothetical protein